MRADLSEVFVTQHFNGRRLRMNYEFKLLLNVECWEIRTGAVYSS